MNKAEQKAEAELNDQIELCYADPYKFIMFIFPWGEKGTPLEAFPEGPDEWHIEEFYRMSDHIMGGIRREKKGEIDFHRPYKSSTGSGHGIGKSAMVAWVIMFFMSTRRYTKGVCTANTLNQLETKTWPELKKWWGMAANRHWFKWTATKFYEVNNDATWQFNAIPWSEENTEAFAGLHNAAGSVVIIFDEASAIPPPIWEVCEGAMTDGEPWWFAYGNPTQNSGVFYDTHHTLNNRWHNRTVDSRTVRITNKRYLDELIEDHGLESDFVKVRILGQFPEGGSMQYIDGGSIMGALERELEYDFRAEVVLALDVARGGGDMSVCGLREGRILDKRKVWRWDLRDSMKLATKVYDLAKIHNPDAIHVDGAGIGGPVCDRLKQMGLKNVVEINGGSTQEVDTSKHKNMRGQMYHNLKYWLPTADICKYGKIKEDLFAMEYDVEEAKHGNFILETKKAFKKRLHRSCDDSDMLAISLAVPVRIRVFDRGLANQGGIQYAESEYDLFGG